MSATTFSATLGHLLRASSPPADQLQSVGALQPAPLPQPLVFHTPLHVPSPVTFIPIPAENEETLNSSLLVQNAFQFLRNFPVVSLNTGDIGNSNWAPSAASLGAPIACSGTGTFPSGDDAVTESPSPTREATDNLQSRYFLRILGLTLPSLAVLLRLAVRFSNSATSAAAKFKWTLVHWIFLTNVTVLLAAGAVEASAAFFSPQPRPTTQGDTDARAIARKTYTRVAVSSLSALSLFLLLVGLGCMKFASTTDVTAV